MKEQSPEDLQEIQIQRLITFANFISGIKMNYPTDDSSKFRITKKQSGFDVDADNFTFVWVIGLLPLLFGRYWAYSNTERVVLKSEPEWSTCKAIQYFFGLEITEYFTVFVAYFQEGGLKIIPHDTLNGENIASNIRTIVARKLTKNQNANERTPKITAS